MPNPDAVKLERATPDRAPLLRNLLELYIHDLSAIFPVELGADGRFGYDKLSLYWQEPASRHAFLIKHGPHVAGFALATRGSPATDDPDDLDVAEFFVLRAHRRSGVGSRAAFALWDTMPGRWVVRVLESNSPALAFWRSAVARYASGGFAERALADSPRAWRVLTLESGRRA